LEKVLKHRDLVRTRERYAPVYDVLKDDEIDSPWYTFIPHSSFYKLLEKFLDILEGKNPRTALWLQGAYGTGKSHACGVLKHLFSDPLEQIESYISAFSVQELKGRLKGLRQRKKYLTVALKGNEGLIRSEYLEITLKEKIRREAERKFRIKLIDKTEIDLMAEHAKNLGREWFKSKKELTSVFTSLEAFVEALKKHDKTALDKAFEVFGKDGVFFYKEFSSWIKNSLTTLKENGVDGVIIIWDEFTTLLTEPLYASKLQDILAENKDIYVLIVTHRTYDQVSSKMDKDTLRKIQDRFVFHRFEMEEVTAFKILSNILQKTPLWEKVCDSYWQNEKFSQLVSLLSEEEKTKGITERNLKELYPFHPYTAFLVTYTVNEFLSANRGIFDFLYSKDGAFQKFLEEEVEKEPFLTPDYLWDFFHSAIEKEAFAEGVGSILGLYNLYKNKVAEKGEEYLRIFKTVLILNLLVRETKVPRELLKPKEENIKLAYVGTPLEKKISQILDWIDREGIVRKDPEGNFKIEGLNLPAAEVRKKEEELRIKFDKTAKVFDSKEFSDFYEELKKKFSEGILRGINPKLGGVSFHIFTNKSRLVYFLENDTTPYSLKLVLGIPTYGWEIPETRVLFKELSDRYPNALFLTLDVETENFLKRFIHFKAREEVSIKREQVENVSYYKRQVEVLLSKLVDELKRSYVYLAFRGADSKETISDASKLLKEACRKVFYLGAENLPHINNQNLWKQGATSGFLNKVLSSRNLRELEKSFSSGVDSFLLDALRDADNNYVVDVNLKVKERAPKSHPLAALVERIGKIFEKRNLVRPSDFFELQAPPFGLFNTKLHGFLLAVAFKNFESDLYVARGKAGVVDLQTFIQQVLTGKDRENVALRLGSETDRKLLYYLKDIFHNYLEEEDLEEDDLTSLKWKIRQGINRKVGWPLWMVEYLEGTGENLRKAIEKINNYLRGHEESIGEEKQREELLKLLEEDNIELKVLLSDPQKILKGKERFLQLKLSGRSLDKKVLEERIKRIFTNEATFWDRGYVERRIEELIENLLSEKEELKTSKNLEKTGVPQKENFEADRLMTFTVSHRIEETRKELLEKLSDLSKERLLSLVEWLVENHPELIEEIKAFLE